MIKKYDNNWTNTVCSAIYNNGELLNKANGVILGKLKNAIFVVIIHQIFSELQSNTD